MSIQSMRDNSEGIVAKIIVGLIIIVFALFGMGSITTFLSPVPKVATVNGEDVTQQEMEIQVERSRRVLLAQGRDPADIDEDQLRRDVLQSLVDRKLLLQASEELGLAYGDSALDAEIVSTPVFQIDGQYSPQQFQLVIGSAGFTPISYREEMRRDKMLGQLNTAIASSAFTTRPEVSRTTSLSQQTRDIAFLRVDVDQIKAEVVVDDAEIESYYEANPDDFMTEETVDLAYLEVKRSDLLDDVVVEEDDLRAFFEDTKDVYAEQERRRVAHILVEVNDDQPEDEARARIEEIYAKITAGEDFATLAREYSQDPGSAEAGGDLGFNDPGTFVEAFEEAAYSLSMNQMSEPVLTEFGFHLIKVLDIEAAKEPVFAEVRDRVEKAYREAEAETLFVDLSSRLSEISYESPDLKDPAAELDLTIQRTGPVTRDAVEGVAANRAVMNAAFSADVLEDGNNSTLIEITPNHHVVVRVAAYQPRELKSLAAVRDEVRDIVALEKAREIAMQRAQEMVAMLEDGSITRYVADQFGLEWQVVAEATRNQASMDREINQEAFALPRPSEGNKSVGYAMLSDGDAAVISVTNVRNKPMAEVASAEIDTMGKVLAFRQGQQSYEAYREHLKQTGDISKL